jgi:hypothetical protein
MVLLPLSPKTAISRLPAVGAVVKVAVTLVKPLVPLPATALYLWTSDGAAAVVVLWSVATPPAMTMAVSSAIARGRRPIMRRDLRPSGAAKRRYRGSAALLILTATSSCERSRDYSLSTTFDGQTAVSDKRRFAMIDRWATWRLGFPPPALST